MNNKRNSKKSRIEAVVIALLFIGTALIVPVSTVAKSPQKIVTSNEGSQQNFYTEDQTNGTFILDRSYYLKETNPASTNTADNDDMGYKKDSGSKLSTSLALYPGEIKDETPGRGGSGKLTAGSDIDDYYYFSVCQGQKMVITMAPPSGFDFNLILWSYTGGATSVAASSNTTGPETISFTATYTGRWYIDVRFVSGSGTGRYTLNVAITSQNDANSGADAGNTLSSALTITPGTYYGYLDMNDPYDFYKFSASVGQGIHLTLAMKNIAVLTDFDLQLYNPNGKLVYEGNQYLDDDFDYPADATGQWTARVDIFPGWVDCPHPTNWSYYSYGSGAYSLTLALGTGGSIPGPIPQPQITPIAKTFKITNDPASTKDDFAYLAAIPACNYLDNGKRYLAPIIYTGDSTPTAYFDDSTSFGTVADTTQYLVDDWNTYLATYGTTATQYTVLADPIAAAADIATHSWTSASTAVVAVDGSGFNDTVSTVVQKTATLTRGSTVENVSCTSKKIVNVGALGYPMFLGSKWCALNVSIIGSGGATPTIGNIFPTFLTMAQDWWPVPYDDSSGGPRTDMYFPITTPGLWVAGLDSQSSNSWFLITKYAGDRYQFKVTGADSVINAKLTTTDPSDLIVYLVDPNGIIRAPTMPAWNGPVNPLGIWNGLSNPAYNPWRNWHPAAHTEWSDEVLHPETGAWTAIVVPRDATGANFKYTLNVDVRTVSADRADATMSAANAAVIASLNHMPLLYVTKDSVPTATASAFTKLGVTNTIFVERNEIGAGVRSKLPTVQKDLKTMQEIVDEIKSYPASQNYITVTSLKSGSGFFAPAAMLAAYHGSPVIRTEDAPNGDPAAVAERIHVWQRWDGDFYHGSRSTGHLPESSSPQPQNKMKVFLTVVEFALGMKVTVPDYGLDAKLNWNNEMVTKLTAYVKSLGLDKAGQEAYATVASRDDITLELASALLGNNSYAGDIPGATPAYANDIVVRDILYPALIFANPGRNVTTASMMNFPDGGEWTTNDGKTEPAYSSRVLKDTFSSHLRTFDSHTLWPAYLQRMQEGASVYYYSGHGTGGSGMSSMYTQSDLSKYPDQIWWDAWRGYMYDNWKMPRENGAMIWFNPEPPELYRLNHYKWIDQALGDLKSQAILYMSCTTWDGDGPMVYLDHGAVMGYGNAGTGLCPEADLADDHMFTDVMVNGMSVAQAFSHQVWLHYRDYTTNDLTSRYGPSSAQVTTIQIIYGDPSLIIYSPEWQSPVPIAG